MKTTIDIPDPIYKNIKKLAAEKGLTFKAIIEAAVREYLEYPHRRRPSFRLKKHPFGGQGLQEGIVEGNWAQIRSLIYESRKNDRR